MGIYALGAGGRGFESRYPDKTKSFINRVLTLDL